jgi:hypothetical protein
MQEMHGEQKTFEREPGNQSRLTLPLVEVLKPPVKVSKHALSERMYKVASTGFFLNRCAK